MSPEDDGVVGHWRLDAQTLGRMRLDHLRASANAERWDEVELEAEELLDDDPNNVEALFLLGEACLALGHFEVARGAYESASKLDAEGAVVATSKVLAGRAIACLHSCDVIEAAELARAVIHLDPEAAEAHHVLSVALDFVPGRSAEGLAARTAAARLDPDRYALPDARRTPPVEALITRALEQVSPDVKAFCDAVPFEIRDLPELPRLRERVPAASPAAVALVLGGAPGDTPPGAEPKLVIQVYRRNLERCPTAEAMIEALAQDLEDEVEPLLSPLDDDDEDPYEDE